MILMKVINDSLAHLQKLELEILIEFDKFCQNNNLKYYLAEGTLLGAVRHKGFIPWDDDIDVMMPREDYEKFLKLAIKKFNKNYKIQCIQTEPKYWVIASKIRMLKDTGYVQNDVLKMTDNAGVYIDIFPLDYLPEIYSKEIAFNFKMIRLLRRMLWLKTGFSKKKNLRNKILKFFANFISVEKYHELIKKRMTKYNNRSHKYIVNYGSYYPLSKLIIPAHVYGEGKYLDFENYKFLVPNDYDYILTNVYGDYMQLPPENKRKHKHTFTFKKND